jgi:nitroreductase
MSTLTPDELLTTTRSVRRRLDFERPVELDLIRECLSLAVQAPTGGNAQGWHFVVITEPAKKQALGDLYRRAWAIYLQLPQNQPARLPADPDARATLMRVRDSADYLAEHLHQAPVLVLPCVRGRVEQAPQTHAPLPQHPGAPAPAVRRGGEGYTSWAGVAVFAQASLYGSILPAAWSFMLAARSRGLAACWTTVHLMFEAEAAQLLGIPYDKVTQAALIPVAYPRGAAFKPAARKPLDDVLHLEAW